MEAELRLTGLDDALECLARLDPQAILEAAEPALMQGLTAIRDEAAGLCPVDTGALRASLDTRLRFGENELTGEVYAGEPYALPVEMGSARGDGGRPAQPFLYPALKANQQKATDAIAQAVIRYAEGGGNQA